MKDQGTEQSITDMLTAICLSKEQRLPVPFYEQDGITIFHGRNEDILPLLAAESFHAVVTDPPAGISMMNMAWDGDKGGRNQWVVWMTQTMREVLRVLKPGAHGLIWALPRTSHWTAWALEEAGMEVRDRISHLFASGFPKSLSVSKAIDRTAGVEREVIGVKSYAGPTGNNANFGIGNLSLNETKRVLSAPATNAAKQWDGWGSALKPSCEDWWLCKKPLIGTICENILAHGTGALNIDVSRVGPHDPDLNRLSRANKQPLSRLSQVFETTPASIAQHTLGRFPSNILHDGSAEVLAEFAKAGERASGGYPAEGSIRHTRVAYGEWGPRTEARFGANSGSAARFFFCSKSSRAEREENLGDMTPTNGTRRNTHATVKPLRLMQYLLTLITPPGGLVLDPFMGSGSTLVAAQSLGFSCIGIEQEEAYCEIAARRLRQGVLPFPAPQQEENPPVPVAVQSGLWGEEP